MLARLAAIEADLRGRLAEPHRHYHGQSHIDALLALLATKRKDFHHPDAVEIAIWFHDAIYRPGAPDNERASAALMRESLGHLIDADLVAMADVMILATETHRLPPDLAPDVLADAALFLDFDMAILGAEPAIYDRYAEGVRLEFSPVVGEAAYRAGRADFLARTLAAGTSLFHTEWGRRLDAVARANMARERAALVAQDAVAKR